MAQGFDEASGKVLGNPVLLIPRIGRVGPLALRPTIGVSSTGILAYQNADDVMTARLTWVDRSGLPVRTLSPDAFVDGPRLSPDQLSVAGTQPSGAQDIWVTDLVRESSERKTFEGTRGNSAVWSKDGTRLAFSRPQSGIYAIDLNSGGKPTLLTETRGVPISWTGRHLLYISRVQRPGKLYLLDLTGGHKPVKIGPPNGNSFSGEFSPNGKFIAFDSERAGRYEVYVQPIPPAAGETRVSINGGGVPRWRGDGKEIFFISPAGDLMAVDIKLGDPVSVGIPHKLFRFDSRDGYAVAAHGYDVAMNGERFLIVSLKEFNLPITVVLNWWVELEKRIGR